MLLPYFCLQEINWILNKRRPQITKNFINGAAFNRVRGTQRIVSVNYLFGRPLIPSDFLERIGTSNFRDMRNLMSVVFGLLKMSFWVPKKGQLSFSERR